MIERGRVIPKTYEDIVASFSAEEWTASPFMWCVPRKLITWPLSRPIGPALMNGIVGIRKGRSYELPSLSGKNGKGKCSLPY